MSMRASAFRLRAFSAIFISVTQRAICATSAARFVAIASRSAAVSTIAR